jgi:hypothetical protein
MNQEERWKFITDLDGELLKGGVILSEWCSFIVREADTAFVGSAHLATVVTAMAGIETYLRSEYATRRSTTLHDLVEQSPLDDNLKHDIHALRRFRNRWVHVGDPTEDRELLDDPEKFEQELVQMARVAIRTLRMTIYENQWV